MSKKQHAYFMKLYEPVHARFERFCRARVYGRMDYEDLMNETLLVAYQKLDTLKSEAAFLSFLFSIAVRILANDNRKKKEELEVSEHALKAFPDVNANSDIDTDVTFLHQALNCLPEAQKEAIILFEIAGFNLKEISEIQEATLSAVKQRLKRGRESLTEILTKVQEYKNSTKTRLGDEDSASPKLRRTKGEVNNGK